VRQQRKLRTRQQILDTSTKLFAERGFDEVTVAEIASGANVSVTTLFQHFRSKEDLLLSQLDEVHAELVDALRTREPGQSPLDTVKRFLLERLSVAPPGGPERFWRTVGSSQAVTSLRRRLYQDWEDSIVEVLAADANEAAATPLTRLVAAQLVSMIRVSTSPEVRAFLNRYPPERRTEVYAQWIEQACEMLAHGLEDRTISGG
jgi:AcrR family transcriptional regulator